eukprot:1154164-Pelagomonas_calceolata.AAC.3
MHATCRSLNTQRPPHHNCAYSNTHTQAPVVLACPAFRPQLDGTHCQLQPHAQTGVNEHTLAWFFRHACMPCLQATARWHVLPAAATCKHKCERANASTIYYHRGIQLHSSLYILPVGQSTYMAQSCLPAAAARACECYQILPAIHSAAIVGLATAGNVLGIKQRRMALPSQNRAS